MPAEHASSLPHSETRAKLNAPQQVALTFRSCGNTRTEKVFSIAALPEFTMLEDPKAV